LRNKSILI